MIPYSSGDLTSVRQHWLKGHEMGAADYDGRTALHLAACEGHFNVIRFLVETCKVDINVEDNWGNIPVDEARRRGFKDIVKYLENQHPYETSSNEWSEGWETGQHMGTL